MTIRTIPHNAGLDTVWSELVYTEARLQNDSLARRHAPEIPPLVERTERTQAEQRTHWRAEIVAQAAVDTRDDAVDHLVDEMEDKLFHAVGRDHGDARYKRYFPRPKGEILRMGLESELERVRTWPDSLGTEPEAELKSAGRALANEIAAGDEAVSARRKAIAATADHRARKIVTLIDDVNAARLSLYGALVKIGVAHKLPKDWAASFFRHAERSAPAAVDAPTTGGTG